MKILMTLVASLVASSAVALEFRCPVKISTKQSLAQPADGWSSSVDSDTPHWNDGLTVYNGPPSEKASLVPDGPEGAEFWVNDLKFGGLWMECAYFRSAVKLQRKIPSNVKRCALKLGPNKSYYSLICE